MIGAGITGGDLRELFPYALLIGGALLLVAFSSARKPATAAEPPLLFAWSTALAALGSLYLLGEVPEPFDRQLAHDRTGRGFAQVILALLLLVLPLLPVTRMRSSASRNGTAGLLLLSAAGGILMACANDLIVFFLGLELLSLPLYVLTCAGPTSKPTAEAAFKYFLLGAVSSAVYVYGAALLWGSLGTLRVPEIASALGGPVESKALAVLGGGLVAAGLAFKIGLVPFHMWVPDVYEGAPSWLVAWMSGAVKAGTFAFAFRFFAEAMPEATKAWPAVLNSLAVFSMAWGSLAALYQRDVKRMLAYSSVAHAGYATLALAAASEGFGKEAGAALVFYSAAYGVASLAAFLVVSLEEAEGRTRIEDFSGLARRRPAVALVFAAALLSLAGLPPLGGFVAKFNVFLLALRGGHYLPVLVGIVTSVISLAYYLAVIVAAYMKEPAEPRAFRVGRAALLVLGGSGLATLLLGLWPGGILGFFLK